MPEHDDIPLVTRDELSEGAVILDVRDDAEWSRGHIDGAVHIPFDSLPNHAHYNPEALQAEGPVVVVCRGGGSRSARATAWLNANGFEAVKLEGGTRGWLDAGLPMASADGTPTVD